MQTRGSVKQHTLGENANYEVLMSRVQDSSIIHKDQTRQHLGQLYTTH
jgi:hypothetical protein